MGYKRFGPEDLVYSTLVAKPEYYFSIQNGSVYKNDEILPTGDFSNKEKHISDGQVSLHEININRPANSLVKGFIEKDTTRYAYRTISTKVFDDASQFQYGNILTQSYPLKAGLSRIFVPAGVEYNEQNFKNLDSPTISDNNKKYIRALQNVIESRETLGQNFTYGSMGTKAVNMVCVPAIFYGSTIDKGSVELNYYISGTLNSQLKDINKDGILVETTGSSVGSTAGIALYEHGIFLLTGSWSQHHSYQDKFLSAANTSPNWLSFGTGLAQVGTALAHQTVLSSSYSIKFKGTNKIPTLTMLATAEKGRYSYSNNPTFLEETTKQAAASNSRYLEPERKIKNIVNSNLENHSASFDNITYISKVGIYDENKNLIAIASLANPIKKTRSRDYMIKMRLDF
tara:strand:+ start:516 stop:1715 length:1200 start_codon:yes stop_codon:yes gene_type:complete